jgi:hypothetical protein
MQAWLPGSEPPRSSRFLPVRGAKLKETIRTMQDFKGPSRMMIIQGALLILVAIIHLVMTPEIGKIVAHNTTASTYVFLWPPYMLDHVAVGILLFPLGISTMLCASGVVRGDKLARRIACLNALAVLGLAMAVVGAVPLRILLSAPPFLAATAILMLAGLWMLWPVVAFRK